MHFSSKYDTFFGVLWVHFEPLLEWKCAYSCQHLRTEKEGIYVKKDNIKEAIANQVTFHLEIQFHKIHLSQIMTIFSGTDSSILNPC